MIQYVLRILRSSCFRFADMWLRQVRRARYRRTHVDSGAVVHFIFKTQPQSPLVMRHAFGARVCSLFLLQNGTSFLPFLAFSPFTQGFGVRVHLPLHKQCRQQLVVLPPSSQKKKGVVLTYDRLLELVQNV